MVAVYKQPTDYSLMNHTIRDAKLMYKTGRSVGDSGTHSGVCQYAYKTGDMVAYSPTVDPNTSAVTKCGSRTYLGSAALWVDC